MKYLLIASDYDRTLTNSNDVVPPINFIKIRQYIQKGGVFCINTGRELNSILGVFNKSPLNDLDIPLISHQGGVIHFPKSNKTIYKKYLEVSDVIELMSYLDDHNYKSFVFTEQNLIATKVSSFMHDYIRVLNMNPKIVIVKSYADYFLNHDDLPMKVNVTAPNKGLKKIINDAKKYYNLTFTQVGFDMAELVSNEASKGLALEYLCEYLNIPISKTIGIGDALNDVSLIQKAGLGIAVANAEIELKEKANLVTVSSNDGAVAHIIDLVLSDLL